MTTTRDRSGRRCPARRTTPRRPTASTRSGSSTATGSTSAGPSGCPSPARGCASRSAARACWSSAARTSRSAGSTTSAATAARASATTSRASRAPTCAVPTTRGATRSTARLVTTPMIEKEEIDRETTSLWPVHVDVWEGFVFVNLSREEPRPLLEHLADQQDDALAPGPRRALRAAHRTHLDDRRAGQLEDRHRELQRVPALPDDPPRARGGGAGVQEGLHLRERPRGRRRHAGRRAYGDGHRRRGCGCRCCRGSRGRAIPRPTTARRSTRRCSSTSTARPAWPRPSSRRARRAAGW